MNHKLGEMWIVRGQPRRMVHVRRGRGRFAYRTGRNDEVNAGDFNFSRAGKDMAGMFFNGVAEVGQNRVIALRFRTYVKVVGRTK
jgi:hypothetical protein